MWIFLPDSFLSVVENFNDSSKLLVRGRRKGDIEKIFPSAEIKHTPEGDYAFRASIDRALVANTIAKQIMDINYPNFKNEVTDHVRHAAYLDIWQTMWNYQHTRP